MNKIEMQLHNLNKEPLQEWFEYSCSMWANHYNFMLGIPWNTEAENVWFQQNLNANKLYYV
jgi:hypothetical protein